MEFRIFRRGGETLCARFRPFRTSDAAGIIACIRDEYGETYFRRDFYDPQFLIAEHARGKATFYVAETEVGEVAGMLVLNLLPATETGCEIATQIFRLKYRGFGMAKPFFTYIFAKLRQMNEQRPISALLCLSVLFHDVTERLMERAGFHPAGFVFGKFRMDVVTHQYPTDANAKHPAGIMIRKLAKRAAGEIYLPAAHADFVHGIYDALAVPFSIRTTGAPSETSEASFVQDENHGNCAIFVNRSGSDVAACVAAIEARCRAPQQTYNVFLNTSDPGAIFACRALEARGYFLAGVHPLLSSVERIVLHKPGKIPLDLSSFVLTPRFQSIARYVRHCYEAMRSKADPLAAADSLPAKRAGGAP